MIRAAWPLVAQAGEHAADQVRAELERVLARGEFHRQPSLLEELLDWLLPQLGSERVASIGEVLRWLLVLGLGVGLTLLVVQGLRGLRTRHPGAEGEPRPGHSDSGLRVRGLLAEAQAARARGDLRLALRHYFLALLLALGGRGDLEYREAWTNRELLRRGRPSQEARALLEALLHELEPKEFGRQAVSQADVQRLADLVARELTPSGASS